MGVKGRSSTARVIIDFPDDGARLPIRDTVNCFGWLAGRGNAAAGTRENWKALLTWKGGGKASGTWIGPLPAMNGKKYGWGFSFAVPAEEQDIRSFQLEVGLYLKPEDAVPLLSESISFGRRRRRRSGGGKKPVARVQALLGPPTTSYPTTGTTGLSRGLTAVGSFNGTAPASITGTLQNTRPGVVPPSLGGLSQDPPPTGYDWAFQFTVPRSWLSTDLCTLLVQETDSDGYTTSDSQVNLQFM
jgi:hypothetical protein